MTRIQLLGYSLSPQDMPSKSYSQWTFLCIPYDWLCLCTGYIFCCGVLKAKFLILRISITFDSMHVKIGGGTSEWKGSYSSQVVAAVWWQNSVQSELKFSVLHSVVYNVENKYTSIAILAIKTSIPVYSRIRMVWEGGATAVIAVCPVHCVRGPVFCFTLQQWRPVICHCKR